MAPTDPHPPPLLPAVGKDELRGDVALFDAHNLGRIASAVLAGSLRHGDYFKGLSGAAELRKCAEREG